MPSTFIFGEKDTLESALVPTQDSGDQNYYLITTTYGGGGRRTTTITSVVAGLDAPLLTGVINWIKGNFKIGRYERACSDVKNRCGGFLSK